MHDHQHHQPSAPSTSKSASYSSDSGTHNQQLQSRSAPNTTNPFDQIAAGTIANSSRKSMTEEVSVLPSSASNCQHSQQIAVSVDCISITGSENNSEIPTDAMNKSDSRHKQMHYGSSSTTFSTGSSNITSSSFGGTVGIISPDRSSEASSSGVATMSSTDPLPLSATLSRTSADDSTPTMSTLTEGITAAGLRKELEPILINAASTMTSGIGQVASLSAISSLSLNATKGVATNTSSAKNNNSMATCCDPTTMVVSQSQAQSTPSLFLHNKQDHFLDSRQFIPSILGGKLDSASTRPNTIIYKTTEQESEGNNELIGNIIHSKPGTSTNPTTSTGIAVHATSPLPSVFNCAATSCSQIICTPLRTIVSQNRRRYQMDGFNLDLTYITDRIIAMGYPADTKEALYRNSMSHIVKFLEHYHPGHYKVFNLRGQYVYDPANFHNRVISFEMTDHHPPRLELMAPFCREVHDYLAADPLNVVAVHCKAGKGRTGVMICAYLCYISFYRTPRQNMDYYSIIRTHNNKGVTIPSQRRYVYYFAHLRERQLNYMPLRCELIGVYLERPPKLSGPFSRGALKVRVASGDVDIFLGDDMWLTGEQYEEDEELHKKYPLTTVNNKQLDPLRPDNDKKYVSRRCYGWTVPENKRVFLEGDIRVDIFQKSRLKLFNVKQERKKIGHIWFNTMFTCPGFCGGQYVHGDEAYPYPESMIVQRRFRRKQQINITDNSRDKSERQLFDDNPSTSAYSAHHPSSAPSMAIGTENSSSADESGKDQLQLREKNMSSRFGTAKKLANGITGNGKKRSTRSPCRQLIESDQKSWHSQDGELTQHRTACIASTSEKAAYSKKECRASLETAESEYEEEIVVEKPPGLDKHCPHELLRGIYPNEKLAPRYGIEEMIREAFQKNLVNDLYNSRRMSQPRDGPLIPKAPIGRPNAGGPNCLIRNSDEHVGIFGVQEIDRAYKSKDIEMGFKVFILTRCIDESIPSDVRLAEQFVHITHQKQAQKEKDKLEKMQQRHRKLLQSHQQQKRQNTTSDNKEVERDIGKILAHPCSTCAGPLEQQELKAENEDCSTPISPQQKQFITDPRLSDPHLSKFFFRQRVNSQSRHPSVHHHCSLRKNNRQICAKYGCGGADVVKETKWIPASGSSLVVPDYHCNVEETEEENELDEADGEDTYSFDDFDFFHPRQQTCSTIRGVRINRKSACTDTIADVSYTNNSQTTDGKMDCQSMGIHYLPSTFSNEPMAGQHVDTKICSSETSGHSALPSIRDPVEKNSTSSAPNSSILELAESEVYHPSDCSLAPSTSSSCSSSD